MRIPRPIVAGVARAEEMAVLRVDRIDYPGAKVFDRLEPFFRRWKRFW